MRSGRSTCAATGMHSCCVVAARRGARCRGGGRLPRHGRRQPQVYTAKAHDLPGPATLARAAPRRFRAPRQNPSTVRTIIHSEAALRAAARRAGMPVSKLRGHVSSQTVSRLADQARPDTARADHRYRRGTAEDRGRRQHARGDRDQGHLLATSRSRSPRSSPSSTNYAQTLAGIDRQLPELRRAASSAGTDRGLVLGLALSSLTQQRSQVVQSQATAQQLLWSRRPSRRAG